MKQTAVEWQFEQLFNSFEKFNNGECKFNDYLKRNLEIREQAKEMEKQQIIDACNKMQIIQDIDCDGNVTFWFQPEQYYNETFNLSQQDKP